MHSNCNVSHWSLFTSVPSVPLLLTKGQSAAFFFCLEHIKMHVNTCKCTRMHLGNMPGTNTDLCSNKTVNKKNSWKKKLNKKKTCKFDGPLCLFLPLLFYVIQMCNLLFKGAFILSTKITFVSLLTWWKYNLNLWQRAVEQWNKVICQVTKQLIWSLCYCQP